MKAGRRVHTPDRARSHRRFRVERGTRPRPEVNTRQREGGLEWKRKGNIPGRGLSDSGGRRTVLGAKALRRRAVSAATKGTGSSRRTRTESEGKRTGIGQPARRVLTDHGNQRDERCQPGWKEQCGKAKSARLRWMPSGLATRQLSLAYSSKPVHNHPQEPWPERSAPGPRTDRSQPRLHPRAHPAQTPAPPTGTTTPRPRYAPPRGSDLDVQVAVEIGCRRVEVGLKLRSRPASGVVRSRAGRGHARFGESEFRVHAVWGRGRNSVDRFPDLAGGRLRRAAATCLTSDRAGVGGQ